MYKKEKTDSLETSPPSFLAQPKLCTTIHTYRNPSSNLPLHTSLSLHMPKASTHTHSQILVPSPRAMMDQHPRRRPTSSRLPNSDGFHPIILTIIAFIHCALCTSSLLASPSPNVPATTKAAWINDFVTMDEMRMQILLASKKPTRSSPSTANAMAASSSSPSARLLEIDYGYGLGTKYKSVFDNASARQQQRASRSNSTSAGGSIALGEVFPGSVLPGNTGSYFVELELGTPPKRFVFVIDTGSDLFWTRCSLSDTPASPLAFYPKNSSTFENISCADRECNYIPPPPNSICDPKSPSACTYAYGYTDLSQTNGFFGYDTVTMRTSPTSAKKKKAIKLVALGCGTNNSGASVTRGSGVLGLGQGPISFSTQVDAMFQGKFSHCFTSFFSRKLRSALVLGDDPRKNLTSRLQFTPLLQNAMLDTLYYIQLEAIKVGRQSLAIDPSIWKIDRDGNGGTIIDSGTTLTIFPKQVFDRIVSTLQKLIPYPLAPPTAGLSLCYNVSGFDSPLAFPRISMIFKGKATFRPPPRNYFLNPADDIRCLGLLSSSSSLSIIGNLIQQNYFVQYDRKKRLLAFAKASCSLPFNEAD